MCAEKAKLKGKNISLNHYPPLVECNPGMPDDSKQISKVTLHKSTCVC